MISFGNSLLYVAILSEIYKTHLDPRIGYLHTTNNRSFTLNLDLSEIFKPIIVDRTIFKLVNTNMITADDFDKNMGITEAKFMKLKNEMKQLINEEEDSVIFYILRTTSYTKREIIGLEKGGEENFI